MFKGKIEIWEIIKPDNPCDINSDKSICLSWFIFINFQSIFKTLNPGLKLGSPSKILKINLIGSCEYLPSTPNQS